MNGTVYSGTDGTQTCISGCASKLHRAYGRSKARRLLFALQEYEALQEYMAAYSIAAWLDPGSADKVRGEKCFTKRI